MEPHLLVGGSNGDRLQYLVRLLHVTILHPTAADQALVFIQRGFGEDAVRLDYCSRAATVEEPGSGLGGRYLRAGEISFL